MLDLSCIKPLRVTTNLTNMFVPPVPKHNIIAEEITSPIIINIPIITLT